MNIQDWFPLGWTGLISLLSTRLSTVFSSTAIWNFNFSALSLLYCPVFTSVHDYWKNHRFGHFGKVTSLLFNTLSRFVTAFLPRSKQFLISWLQSPSTVNLDPKKIKPVTVSIVFPSIFHEMTRCHDLCFLNASFFTLLFYFIKRLFISFSPSAIKVVSSAYMRLLIFLPTILIPACASSSLVFCMVYSTYNLNNQSDNLQLWCTPFSILNQSMVPCPVLTVVSWTPYRFHRRQVNLAWRILSITLLACVMRAIVQQFEHSLSLPFFGNGMKTDLFQLKDTNALSLKDLICEHCNKKKMYQQLQNLISFLTSFWYFFNIYLITYFVFLATYHCSWDLGSSTSNWTLTFSSDSFES